MNRSEITKERDNVSQKQYEQLINEPTTRHLSEKEAKDILYKLYGFAQEKTIIFNRVMTYVINDEGRLKVSGMQNRSPAYNSPDWNYIYFYCPYGCYEFYNGAIRRYVDIVL